MLANDNIDAVTDHFVCLPAGYLHHLHLPFSTPVHITISSLAGLRLLHLLLLFPLACTCSSAALTFNTVLGRLRIRHLVYHSHCGYSRIGIREQRYVKAVGEAKKSQQFSRREEPQKHAFLFIPVSQPILAIDAYCFIIIIIINAIAVIIVNSADRLQQLGRPEAIEAPLRRIDSCEGIATISIAYVAVISTAN